RRRPRGARGRGDRDAPALLRCARGPRPAHPQRRAGRPCAHRSRAAGGAHRGAGRDDHEGRRKMRPRGLAWSLGVALGRAIRPVPDRLAGGRRPWTRDCLTSSCARSARARCSCVATRRARRRSRRNWSAPAIASPTRSATTFPSCWPTRHAASTPAMAPETAALPPAGPAFVALVPARMASTRLPGKALADIGGKPMVVRVAERALAAGAQRVAVATDDDRIAGAARDAGFEAIMTRADHPTGTDRLAEAAAILALPDDTIVVNVQGDEPLVPP